VACAGVSETTGRNWAAQAGGVIPDRDEPSGRQLSLAERAEIAVGVAAGLSNAEIARRVGRHRSTIGRELKRNQMMWGDRPARARPAPCGLQRRRASRGPRSADPRTLCEYHRSVQINSICGVGMWSPQGKIFGLELDNIDFPRRELPRQQLKRLNGRLPYLGEIKSKTSRRTVELPDIVCRTLARHIEQYPPTELEIEDRFDPRNVRRRIAELLLTTSNSQPLHRSNWSAVWRTTRRRTGLPEGFGLHGLRHYFATLLIHNCASVKTVQMALGHSSMITLNTYAREWPDVLDRTRTVVDAAFGPGTARA
jgi:integrase